MIALDTNLLVYSHRDDSPFNKTATVALNRLMSSTGPCAIPWPCVHEFIGVVTNPRLFKHPTPMPVALQAVRDFMQLPNMQLLSEDEGYWEVLARIATAAQCKGPMIHDARIAALCLHHGVTELWSADRDFSRFADLKTVNPLLAQ